MCSVFRVLITCFALLALGAAPAAADVGVAFLQGEQTAMVDRPGTTAEEAVAALLAGPTAKERRKRMSSAVPARTALRSVTVEGDLATVDLSRDFAGGRNADSLSARVAQLVLTATSVRGVQRVRVLVEGGTPLGLFPGYATKFPITAKDVRGADEPPPPPAPPEPETDPTAGMRRLQTALANLGYLPRSDVDGQWGEQTRFAVIGFQKWERLAPDGIVGPRTQAALEVAVRPTPRTKGPGRRVEVLLDRQLALYIEGGNVKRTLHVSTGAPGFATPKGRYEVFRKEEQSWSIPYQVWLPWASYFVGGVAFHESPDVPARPASHGCVRVPGYDARWLYERLKMGTKVTVL
jgi:hypothetical protein